ncbi:MAG TPA: ParB/RepB/Spo0J family partition protein [Selenomonadales bacterium]|nr:ParB/RepB/Spo0J family partition protein [Selenomonadales bacterium]
MITNIEINKIFPHPDNPRKDLGDLTELAASIKSNGILQNLTVVPDNSGYCPSCRLYNSGVGKCKEGHDKGTKPPCSHWESRGNYRVVIGHRRLAAAKLAGLEGVPCVIADMDPKTQVSTMLLENMQRSDLTIWEQAQGFQMMLDFGETIGDISQQTGFSQNTIRRRMKLLELDGDKFQESVARGATLADYAELDKISDVKLKNIVLDSIGTKDFQWKVKQAIEQEKQEKFKAAIIAELETFATQVQKTDGLHQVQWYNFHSGTKVTKPADAGEIKYFFTDSSYSIVLYKESSENGPSVFAGPSLEKQRQLQEQRQQLDELHKRAYELRGEFVKNYAGRQKDARNIMAFTLKAVLMGELAYCNLNDEICNVLDIEISEPEDEDDCNDEEIMAEAAIFDAFEASPEKVLLATAYCGLEDERAKYHDWQCRFKGSEVLDALYDALKRLGYEISAEERALRDGTHELYVRDDSGEEE